MDFQTSWSGSEEESERENKRVKWNEGARKGKREGERLRGNIIVIRSLLIDWSTKGELISLQY